MTTGDGPSYFDQDAAHPGELLVVDRLRLRRLGGALVIDLAQPVVGRDHQPAGAAIGHEKRRIERQSVVPIERQPGLVARRSDPSSGPA